MLNGRKLVLDTHCEVYEQLCDHADAEFWDLKTHNIIPGAIYLVGRQQFVENINLILQHTDSKTSCLFILSNPHEGSDTLRGQITSLGVRELVEQHKILIIGGGDMESRYPHLRYDKFMVKIFDYEANLRAAEFIDNIFAKTDKPYKFLFLNGFARPHRKYLIEKFRANNLLDQALWTCLDSKGFNSRALTLVQGNKNLMLRPGVVNYLPKEYELPEFQDQVGSIPAGQSFVKFHLFNNQWGDIYLYPPPYIDTYFSLVTETVFEYPYSFRTEKIWKPIAIGHPWIAVSNAGYYKDMRNLGFRTFGHLIDENFDSIENNQDRIDRVADIVRDLCAQDLTAFLAAAQEVCKYNQQHLRDLIPRERDGFLERFTDFIRPYTNE